jgi:hypothetical protein
VAAVGKGAEELEQIGQHLGLDRLAGGQPGSDNLRDLEHAKDGIVLVAKDLGSTFHI